MPDAKELHALSTEILGEIKFSPPITYLMLEKNI